MPSHLRKKYIDSNGVVDTVALSAAIDNRYAERAAIAKEYRKNRVLSIEHKFKAHISSAKSRGKQHTLTIDEFEMLTVNANCVYCGSTSTGIDRKDSTGHYDVSNCVSCCKQCNLMKHKMNQEEFIGHIRRILTYYNR